jgi:glutamyl-tRNA synthetase
VLEYRDQGYLPDAVFNFLGLLGWSLDDKTEIISRDEFVRHFSLERLLKSPAVFNLEKLDWINGEYMRALSPDDFVDVATPWLERPDAEGGLPSIVPRPLDREYSKRIVPLVQERVKLASKAHEMMGFYYLPGGVEPAVEDLLGKAYAGNRAEAARLLSEVLVLSEQMPAWQSDALLEAYRALADRLGVKFRDLAGMIRVAITGRPVSPPLTESMELLGRERCVLRLREAVQLLQ